MDGLISDLLDAGRIEAARCRSPPSPRRWPAWWTRPGTRSSAGVARHDRGVARL